jgi:hypothetical protein
MTLAEGGMYRHDRHGRVEAILVTDSRVGFQVASSNVVRVETHAEFRDHADPAPVTITPPTTKISATTKPPED